MKINAKKYIIWLILIALFIIAPHATANALGGDTLNMVILSTTDIHGWLMPWDYYTDSPDERYGFAKAATLIDSIRGVHPHTLVLDAGDWLQGNPLADFFARIDTQGRHYPFLKLVDHLGYDAVVIGNHEFNFGIDYLDRQISLTDTPVLGANIYRHGTSDPAYQPYLLKEIEGVSVAIIGLSTPGSAVWDRPRVEGRLDFGDGTEAARRFTEEVKSKSADVVIVLAHTGFEGTSSYTTDGSPEENFGRSIAVSVPDIDHLVLGHAHRVIDDLSVEGPSGKSVGVIMAGRWGSHLGVSELTLVKTADGWTVAGQRTHALPVRNASPHPEIVRLIEEEHSEVRQYINSPIAETPDAWEAARARVEDTPIIDLIQHVQMQVTGAQISAAAAFNPGASFGPGPISLGQLTRLYPYENSLYVLEVTGSQIREFLEYTSQYYLQSIDETAPDINPDWPGYNFDMLAGIVYTLDVRNPVGRRVIRLEYQGQPAGDDDTFTMAVNSYRAEGGGGFSMLADAKVLRIIDKPVRDLIAEYLREMGKIRKADVFTRNWILLPEF